MNPRHAVHRVPPQTKPCGSLSIEIRNNDSKLQLFDANGVRPRRHSRKSSHQDRITEIKASFPYDVALTEVRLSPDSRHIQFVGKPSTVLALRDSLLTPADVEIVSYYERSRKRKILNAFYFANEDPPANIHWALSRYDHFYACDTNTWTFAGIGRVSATTILHGRFGPVTSDFSGGDYELAYVSVAENVVGNPELCALSHLVARVESELSRPPRKKIGIIVDTELGRLKHINARRISICDQDYLPAGYELVYASDSSGTTEYFPNQMIRECDTNSTRVLEEFQSERNLTRVSN